MRKQINKDYWKLYTELVKDENEEERLKKLEERRSIVVYLCLFVIYELFAC